jgi:hypothetical protein
MSLRNFESFLVQANIGLNIKAAKSIESIIFCDTVAAASPVEIASGKAFHLRILLLLKA